MKHLLPLVLIILSIYIYSCANQGTPTGGSKDTIPPTLLESYPPNKTINFKENKFTFAFSEKINAAQLKNKLVITPHIERKFDIRFKKNELTLKLEEGFEDNTTYTLNFSDGIVDITEKNPSINLSLAFSTGAYIDSIHISGRISNLYTNHASEEYLVALYQLSDSLDFRTDKPRYFTKTDKKGKYLIENIKNDYYKMIAFLDDNRDLLLNPANEAHGFLPDSIDLTTSKDSVKIRTQKINAESFRFIRAKKTGQYFDLLYNKPIVELNIKQLDTSEQISIPDYNLIKEYKTIRFYYSTSMKYETDSLGLIIEAIDSMTNNTTDTVHLQFSKSERKKSGFSYTLLPANKTKITEGIDLSIRFNKPIAIFNSDSIAFKYDTLRTILIQDSLYVWNDNRTLLSFETKLVKSYLKKEIDSLISIYSDTTIQDTTYAVKNKYLTKINTSLVSIQIPKNTFISLEQDSSTLIQHNFSFKNIDNYGSVSGAIITTQESFTLQLLNKNFEIIDESINGTTFSFQYVLPGKYTFRVLIDSNKDNTWSYGNILQDKAPEEVFFYDQLFDVRANWQLENITVSF